MATSTQLICPHCGSTLTFGMEMAAGTPVECLICMQTFAAAPLGNAPMPAVAASSIRSADRPTMSDATTTSVPKVANAKPTTTANVPVAKAASSKITAKPIPVAAKANADADLFVLPPIQKNAGSSSRGKFAAWQLHLDWDSYWPVVVSSSPS